MVECKNTRTRVTISYALNEERYRDRILPLLFKKCDFRTLSWVLPQYQMIDFRKDFRRGCEHLLAVWGKRLNARVWNALNP